MNRIKLDNDVRKALGIKEDAPFALAWATDETITNYSSCNNAGEAAALILGFIKQDPVIASLIKSEIENVQTDPDMDKMLAFQKLFDEEDQ